MSSITETARRADTIPPTLDDEETRARLAELEPHLASMADVEVAKSIVARHPERSVASIVEQFTIPYPAPGAKNVPAWVESVDGPSWDWGERCWVRYLRRTYYYPGENGGGVRVSARHMSTETRQWVEDLDFYVNLESIDTPEEARQVAIWLLEAADAVEGPKSSDVGVRSPRPLSTQRAVAELIRRTIRERGLKQNELAVAAGYGTDELSSLMTGRRPMDLNDVERIAEALDLDPFDLLAEAVEA